MAVNTELNSEADRVHAAIENLAPEQADIGPMTPDELNSLISRSQTHELDDASPFGTPKAPTPTATTATLPTAPPPSPQQAMQQQYAPPPPMQAPPPPPPQYAPPPQQQRVYDPRVEQLWAENRMLAEKAARADQMDEWMASHPEVLERIIDGAVQPQAGATPEETLLNEVKRIRRENEATRQYADQRTWEARRMAELSVEATQILHEYSGQIDIQALATYAHRNGIPNLRDALTHAAGAVTLQNLGQQRQQAPQQYAQQYGYATQQRQYPQNYGYAPQQYPQTYAPAEPPPPPPAPPQAAVMRPGMAIPDRPAFRGPARNSEEAYANFEHFLRNNGALG